MIVLNLRIASTINSMIRLTTTIEPNTANKTTMTYEQETWLSMW